MLPAPKIINCFHKSNSSIWDVSHLVELIHLGLKSKPMFYFLNMFHERSESFLLLLKLRQIWKRERIGTHHFNYLRVKKKSKRARW
jgi:hypothetical protein